MALEIIESTATDERGLVAAPVQQAGTLALAAMSDQEFATRLAALKKGRDRIATIQRELMDKDVDYGTIPGTPKPTLLKPGAEKLCDIYSLRADFDPTLTFGDNLTAPALRAQVRCELHLGTLDGPVIAVGYGSANSWERKHRYRTGERACPACGSIGTLLRSKKGEAGWFCWAKKGGCGETFALNDPKVVDQQAGQVDNPDPYDLDVTLLKMAEKRGYIDATLRACAASGLFTQDVEDMPPPAATDDPAPPPEASLEEHIAQRKAEVQSPATGTATCAVASPRGVPCLVEPAGHDGDHRNGNKSWPTPQQGSAPPAEPKATAEATVPVSAVAEAQKGEIVEAPVPPHLAAVNDPDVAAGLGLLDEQPKGGRHP